MSDQENAAWLATCKTKVLENIISELEASISRLSQENEGLRTALSRLETHIRILPPEYDGVGSPLAQAREALGFAARPVSEPQEK